MANYLNNKDMLREVIKSKAQGEATDELCRMFILLVNKIGSRGNFCEYSYVDEMKGDALLMLITKWEQFDVDKYDKPFQYYTSFVWNAFRQQMKKFKNQQKIRDRMIMDAGRDASLNFMDSENTYEDPEL